MGAQEVLSALRALVAERPSARHWAAICQHLNRCQDEHLLELAIDYTVAGLDAARWPDALRVPEHRWLERAGVGLPEPRMRLVRSLVITPRFLSARHSELANAPWLGNIRNITRTQRKTYYTPLKAWEGFAELLSRPALNNLRSLNLTATLLDDPVVDVLATSSNLKSLRLLQLKGTGLTPSMLARLTMSQTLAPVAVDMSDNDLGPGVSSLSSWRTSLKRLKLNNISLDDVCATELVRHNWNLKRLCLRENGLTVQGLRALTAGSELTSLRSLDLSGNPLNEAGGDLLVRARHLQQLSTLILDNVWQAPSASRPFLRGLQDGRLAALKRLSLNRNALGDDSLQMLSRFEGLGSLTHLMLAGNKVSDKGVASLLASNTSDLDALQVLDLSDNDIGDVGVLQLLGVSALSHLEGGLCLQDNPRIGSEGAAALSMSRRVLESERRGWAGIAGL